MWHLETIVMFLGLRKKQKMTIMKKILALLAVGAGVCAACTQDNVHMPETEVKVVEKEVPAKEEFDDSLYYSGALTSSVPTMSALMEPVSTADYMYFRGMTGKSSGYATLVLGQFDITVEAMNMHITMGEMRIDSVQYAFYPSGNGMFFRDNFEVMAGSYNTVGTLSGTFDATGKVSMQMDYKPGSMPFMCHSEMEAERK